ncbi:MAG: glycosyltransferase family 2 protein [Dehalococcoidia bacterium]|nr:glycosyltransferase family 2 protein [Dehalococcoidia bacterium]MDP6228978.1 glycosyltransferase family 2 protein [Dehalococcoidia bacterium]MDP7084418.1 glycosyltransferase family 2 protein [Dehalococcoidia bacterium]MDP7200923.1 glycosyltransferase family 2 protein [Dehalococcoidia bacterium]MDP7510137.1 glycosyltransferase family 2 protein [Dehalococcoidia bacterium]
MASVRECPSPRPFLSIVIPAYNEEPRIGDTLERVIGFLNTRPYSWEVLVADDGSTDGTGRLVGGLAESQPNLHLIKLAHRGKGSAVKNAMLAASGQYRFLCDADLSVPIEQVERFLPPQIEGVDIAIGSREAPGARRIGEPNRRRLMGRVFNTLVRVLAVPRLQDTQCGFKCFRGEIAPDLFKRQTMNGFAFDVEILFLARRTGLAMQEIAVDWYYREQSKVRPVRDSLLMTLDLLKIRWRYRWGRHRRPAARERVESNLP